MTEYIDIKEKNGCEDCACFDDKLNWSIIVYSTVSNNIPYFVLFDNKYPNEASKSCSIRLDKPEYLNIKRNSDNWLLTNNEISLLLTLLREPSVWGSNDKETNFDNIITTFNRLNDTNINIINIPNYEELNA